jgi:adenine-specific DNA-methyltransferase
MKLTDNEMRDINFQIVGQIDEPHAEPADPSKANDEKLSMFEADTRGRQLKGWTNKLNWEGQ